MKTRLFGFALATTILVSTSAALAADMPGPPPVDNLRGSYDWSGAYIGIFGAATAIDGHYVDNCSCGSVTDPEMSGIGYHAGVLGGVNYQLDNNFVVGVEGDWGWGFGHTANNDDPREATWLKLKDIATLRARAGLALDNTLLYVTAGGALANAEFGALVGPGSVKDSQSKWLTGWTIGGGIEEALSSNLHARLEYLYLGLPSKHYTLSDGAGTSCDCKMSYKSAHMVRASLTYNFSW